MSETIVVRFRYADGEERSHMMTIPDDGWPLPEWMDGFHKISESQLPRTKGILRGVLYEPAEDYSDDPVLHP